MLKRLFCNSQRNLCFADSRSEGRTSIAFCTETILYVYDESSQIPVEEEDVASEWEDGVLLLSSNMISAETIAVSQRLVIHSRLVHHVSSDLEGNRSLTTSTDQCERKAFDRISGCLKAGNNGLTFQCTGRS